MRSRRIACATGSALIGGMGGFLVVALAIPMRTRATDSRSGSPTSRSCSCTARMYVKGTSVSEVAAILRIVPYNLTTAGLVVLGGALGGDAQWVLWTRGRRPDLVHTVAHRHRRVLVIGVALRRAARPRDHRRARRVVVVIGVGAAGLPLDLELVLVALLALALSASLWWLYFREEDDVERAMEQAEPSRRARIAVLAIRVLALRTPARRRRRRGGAEEGDRGSVRRARHVGRRGARRRSSALHRLHGRLPRDARSGIGRERLLAAASRSRRFPLGTRLVSDGSARRAHRDQSWVRSSIEAQAARFDLVQPGSLRCPSCEAPRAYLRHRLPGPTDRAGHWLARFSLRTRPKEHHVIDVQEAVMEAVPVEKGVAVEVHELRKEFRRKDSRKRGEKRRRAPLARGTRRRLVHDGEGRDRRHPRPERLGEVDARPPALDAALARRRIGADPRP